MRSPQRPPVLVVGTHRAGTSVLTRSLAEMGLFIGARLDSHGESTFFQRINRRLSSEAGGHWTTPHVTYDTVVGLGDDLGAFVEPLHRLLSGPGSLEYWGHAGLRANAFDGHWGWKDPRNTYVLPIWEEIFPDLRVVWVRRDPRACAASLVRRSREARDRIRDQSTHDGFHAQRRRLTAPLRGRPLLADGWRTLDPMGALDVALAYAELQQRLLSERSYGVHSLDYEQLVERPAAVLQARGDFIGLDGDAEGVARQVAAREHGTLGEFDDLAPELVERLAALGYRA